MGGFWRAVALLRLDRRRGLAELERCFAEGRPPVRLTGPLQGRLLATTVGHGADAVFETLGRVWLPWLGKTFAHGSGRNLFTRGGVRLIRARWPAYRGLDPGSGAAFGFVTSVGPSALVPDVDVLRIDYRDVAENPRWPVRQVLDELVEVEPGLYLGQALLTWRGRLRRAAWFRSSRTLPERPRPIRSGHRSARP
jgi:hypothetical protein